MCPIMAMWCIWNLLIVTCFACHQWFCNADVYHVVVMGTSPHDSEQEYAAVPMALEQYLMDHANNTLLSERIVKWVKGWLIWKYQIHTHICSKTTMVNISTHDNNSQYIYDDKDTSLKLRADELIEKSVLLKIRNNARNMKQKSHWC